MDFLADIVCKTFGSVSTREVQSSKSLNVAHVLEIRRPVFSPEEKSQHGCVTFLECIMII